MKELISDINELENNEAYNKIKEICKPFDEEKYANMPLADVAMYAIDLLHENGINLEHTNMIIGIYSTFPKKFCLQGFLGFPDAERISRTILQLKPKYKEPPVGWIEGTPSLGYNITEKGFVGAEKAAQVLHNSKESPTKKTIENKNRSIFNKKKDDMIKTVAFKKYNDGAKTLSGPELLVGIGRAPFESKKTIMSAISELKRSAIQMSDDEILAYLKFVEKIYLEEIA